MAPRNFALEVSAVQTGPSATPKTSPLPVASLAAIQDVANVRMDRRWAFELGKILLSYS